MDGKHTRLVHFEADMVGTPDSRVVLRRLQ